MRGGGLLVVALLAAAGCAAPAQNTHPVASVAQADPPLLNLDEPVIASVRLHESMNATAVAGGFVTQGVALPVLPRDVQLDYMGLQPAYDEYARPITVYAFRYPVVVYVEERRVGGPLGQGHYEVHPTEFHFDRASGRFVDAVDISNRVRQFNDAADQSPLSILSLLWMTRLADHDNLTAEMPADWDGVERSMTAPSFRPSGWRPFGGDCQAWELVTRNLRTNAIEPPVDGGSSGRTLMCLHEGDLVPLWLWTGTRDGGGLLIERTSASPDLPGLEGTPLAPVAYDLHGWSEVPSPLPLLGGTLAPPSDNAADWAGQVAGLVKAAYTSPEFLLYRRASATPATMLAWLRTPYGTTLTVLGIPIPPHGVSSTFDYQHALFVTDGKQTEFQEFVGNRGGPEQPDTTVATTGSTSEDMDFRITASSAPLLPGAGAVMAQLNPFLPATQGQLVFSLFNLTRSDYWFGPSPLLVLWKAQTECNSNHPSLIVVDAQRGFLRSYEERVTACQESAGLKAAVPLFALGGLNHSLWGRTTPP